MTLNRTDGQRAVIHMATPGTPEHDAMTLLDLADPRVTEPAGKSAGTPAG
jgi:hypothetical protein